MKQLYTAVVSNGISYECLADTELELSEGDMVVVRCERYIDYARISRKIEEPIEDEAEFERQRELASKGRHMEGQKTPEVIRKSTEEDNAQAAENEALAREAHEQTRERISAHGLDMKLIHTHYSLDRKMLMFQFSAEGRIDFRELLRDLSALFRIRVELRQIGVRDEASLLGGIGICGRPFCCTSFLKNFNSINVKMAKQQGISLNPQNISGCCGRLKCCLHYEAEAYNNKPLKQKTTTLPEEADEVVDETMANDEASAAAALDDTQRTRRPRRDGKPCRDNTHDNTGEARKPQEQRHRREQAGKGQQGDKGDKGEQGAQSKQSKQSMQSKQSGQSNQGRPPRGDKHRQRVQPGGSQAGGSQAGNVRQGQRPQRGQRSQRGQRGSDDGRKLENQQSQQGQGQKSTGTGDESQG